MKYVIFILTFLFAIACSSPKVPNTANENTELPNRVELNQQQIQRAGVQIGIAIKQQMSRVLKLNGTIDVPPQNMVSVCAPLGGYLKATQLLPGMHLAKGETIAVLEDPQYIELQQNYLTIKARLIALEQDYQRQKELNKSKAGSDKALEQSLAEFSAQKITLRALAEKLRLISIDPDKLDETTLSHSIRIQSPINGYVSKVNANIGKYVNPTDVLFEIVNPEDIHLALTVFEKDINQLFIGQKLQAYTNNEPQTRYDCEIILIGKDFNQERNVVVHCHFKNYDKRLLPGMFMNAEVQIQNKEVWVVPSEAIQNLNGKAVVFVEEKPGTYRAQEVSTGLEERGFIELIATSNFQPELSKIVVKGAYALLMQMKSAAEE
jgi:cobalt-zinc-cadmium efflux system membrane fusion protein